jgi:RNA polymerase sigma factor (sigma-70 family)
MPWRQAAEGACRRHGFPLKWVDAFAASADDPPKDPRAAAKAFEAWCMHRLASIWAGKVEEADLDGNLAAFLVQGYLTKSARVLAWRYRLSPEEWDDLIAAAAERSLRVFSERYIEAPQPYLFRTIERAVWEYLRKARREVATADMPLAASNQPSPERLASDRQLLAALKHCYELLEPSDATLFESLEVQGLTAEAAGRPFGLTANAVNVRKFRIRKRLKGCMQERTGLIDPFRGDST